MISLALKVHLGKDIQFPEENVRIADWFVCETQKDMKWCKQSEEDIAFRHFAANAVTNAHLTTHARRCFKKRDECFANLPEEPADATIFHCNEVPDTWSDWLGWKEKRHMFSVQPKCNIEDCFVNTHNPLMTKLTGYNNNMLFCMTGPIVTHATSCNVKPQQKEERATFELVGRSLTGAVN